VCAPPRVLTRCDLIIEMVPGEDYQWSALGHTAAVTPYIFPANKSRVRQRQFRARVFKHLLYRGLRDLWEHSVVFFLLTALEINVSRSSPYKVNTNFYNSFGILALILLFQFQITFLGGRYLVQCAVWACSKRTSEFVFCNVLGLVCNRILGSSTAIFRRCNKNLSFIS
jgi:hypothetical protein